MLITLSVGLEYQNGTIRVLLARGVGRLQLLGAKLLTVAAVALVILVGGLLLNVVETCAVLLLTSGNLDALKALNADFWGDASLYLLTVLISAGVTILLGLTAAVIGRSLAFGLTAALIFFPVDNIGVEFMNLAYQITQNEFWKNITAIWLGPNLNMMPAELLPVRSFYGDTTTLGFKPLVSADFTHTLIVVLVYAAIFLGVSAVLTWRRDVKE
jgi:ABC-type transport system involved in multi-copper enzyme maturation permease subunit